MKRSDMVKAIAEELDDIRIENYYDEKGSYWCSSLILTRLEEEGMIPPSYIKLEEFTHSVIPLLYKDRKMFIETPVNDWEPEATGERSSEGADESKDS